MVGAVEKALVRILGQLFEENLDEEFPKLRENIKLEEAQCMLTKLVESEN